MYYFVTTVAEMIRHLHALIINGMYYTSSVIEIHGHFMNAVSVLHYALYCEMEMVMYVDMCRSCIVVNEQVYKHTNDHN